jgi:hypothetical protein
MLAAFGVPGAAMPMTGERLKAWERQQAGGAVGMPPERKRSPAVPGRLAGAMERSREVASLVTRLGA